MLLRAASYLENEVRVPQSLRELLAELQRNTINTGICGEECFVEIDGEKHYFPDDFVDSKDPCIIYYCDVRQLILLHIKVYFNPSSVSHFLGVWRLEILQMTARYGLAMAGWRICLECAAQLV